MKTEKRSLFIPIFKDGENYRAILSDDSLDRDEEYMSPDLIHKWSRGENAIPILSDHENSMDEFIGAWKDRKVISSQDGHVGLSMQPIFFSQDANPKAQRIKKQIDEAIAMGLQPGVSVGFIPKSGYKTEKGYMHTDAELLEASFVPIQSNRNAFAYLAKRFQLYQTLKKGSEVIGASGIMAEETQKTEEVKTENTQKAEDPMMALTVRMDKLEADFASRITACEQAVAAINENSAKASELSKVEAEKRIAQEAQIKKELETTKKELEAVKEIAKSPKATIPSALKSVLEKDAKPEKEEYNAAVEVAKKRGLYQN